MSAPLGPRPAISHTRAGRTWVGVLLASSPVAVAWVIHLAAELAAAVAGGKVAAFDVAFIAEVITGSGARAWPGTPTGLVAVIAAALFMAVIAAGGGVWWLASGRHGDAADPTGALARRFRAAGRTRDEMARKAIQLRPSLAGRDPRTLSDGDIGLVLGDLVQPGRQPGKKIRSWVGRKIFGGLK